MSNFFTYNESKEFGKNQENRQINHSHLQKIKKQCLEHLDRMPAITVNRITNNVIDGQHRLEAFQFLVENGSLPSDSKIEVKLIDIPEEDEKGAIVDANTNSKNWSLDDYIASYIQGGNTDYTSLLNQCNEHDLSYTYKTNKSNGKQIKLPNYRYGAAIIKGKNCSNELKNGNFTLTEEECKKGHIIHEELKTLIEKLEIQGKGAWVEAMAIQWHEHREMHSFDEWLEGIKKNKSTLKNYSKNNQKDFESIFSLINTKIDKMKQKAMAMAS